MKEFIAKKLGGKRVRLTDTAHTMEYERLTRLGVKLNSEDPRGNAIQIRRHLGWDVVGGWILFELAQGCGRKDTVEKSIYHGEAHWWNVTNKGLWMDLSPRREQHKRMVLVESARTPLPIATPEEEEAMTRPAERADELIADFVVDGVEMRGLRLTEKHLDGTDVEPLFFIDACFRIAEKALRELQPGTTIDKHRLRQITLDGVALRNTTSTLARKLLDRSGRRVELIMYPPNAPEISLLRAYTLHVPRLREGTTLCFTRLSESSRKLSVRELGVFATLAAEHCPLGVQQLYLDENEFGDDGVAVIAPLLGTALPSLDRLILTANGITDRGVASLIDGLRAASARPLLHLDLSSNQLTDEGVASLVQEVATGAIKVSQIDVTGNKRGSRWTLVGVERPQNGNEIASETLSKALQDNKPGSLFSCGDVDKFGLKDERDGDVENVLKLNSYIKVGNVYFQQASKGTVSTAAEAQLKSALKQARLARAEGTVEPQLELN